MAQLRSNRLTATRACERRLLVQVKAEIDRREIPMGLLDELIIESRRRAASSPRNASWHLLLGRFLMATGDPLEARVSLQRALALEPRSVRTLAHLGVWHEAARASAIGDERNIALPDLGDVGLCADVSHFAAFYHGPAAALSARAAAFFRTALSQNLSAADRDVLEAHLHRVSVEIEDRHPPAGLPRRRAIPRTVSSGELVDSTS
jgi:hypothetical protein